MLLNALKGENKDRPPVWIMRQAGRYLPQYRQLREKHSLKELFFTPELAAKVTKMPIDILGVDAAILFADITTVVLALGLQLDFSEGPVISGSIQRVDANKVLKPVADAIGIIKNEISEPLLGFCGGPFTVASYILEKHNGSDLPVTKKKLYQSPHEMIHLLEQITEATIDYLRLQEKAGVDAVQIFDSWAHVLSEEHFDLVCMPYLKRLIDAVKIPVILYMRGACTRVQKLVSLNPACISFDWQRPISEMRKLTPMAVQGNLDPDLLYAPLPVIEEKTKQLLISMEKDPAFIVNLGHGMKPDMSVDAVKCFVNTVKKGVNNDKLHIAGFAV
jgi:uroporphyrinogen decarboxylase